MLPSLVLALLPCVAALRAAPLGASAAAAPPVAAAPVSCEALVLRLFGGSAGPRGADTAGFDAGAVAAACADDVEWDDVSLAAPVVGRAAVRAMLEAKFPPGSRLVPERVTDGAASGGFTWHRAALGTSAGRGLRGTTFLELDGAGRIAYAREAAEPLFKPGAVTERLLKAVTAAAKDQPRPAPSYTPRTPTTAAGIVEYLWREAYPRGAPPTEALRLFADDIRYEDFNYARPFVGKPAVAEFVTAFDIPGVEFVPLRVSDGGARACCFTWRVRVNGQDGPEGVSFYETGADGRVAFIRDIPAPSIKPPPLATLAALVDPRLRVFAPRPDEDE